MNCEDGLKHVHQGSASSCFLVWCHTLSLGPSVQVRGLGPLFFCKSSLLSFAFKGAHRALRHCVEGTVISRRERERDEIISIF